jgi:ribonuclease-3
MAFIHRSATHKLPDGTSINNERLEFLGDAILDAILSEYFFEIYNDASEGDLTKLRAKLVNREHLNKLASRIGINQILISHITKSNQTRHLYGDALEALIGSVFIDKGYSKTKKFVIRQIIGNHTDLKEVLNTENDHKSQVFQWAQKMNKQISFNYVEDYDFNNKKNLFTTSLRVDHELYGEGSGSSKKEAEQEASSEAWKKIIKSGYIE